MSRQRALSRDAVRPPRDERATRATTELGTRGVATLLVLGCIATGLGMFHVKTVFDARDWEMEARRIQDATTRRRDESRRLEVQAGNMRRGEMLRQAASKSFGMVDPEPGLVREIQVSEESRERWARAEKLARAQLALAERR